MLNHSTLPYTRHWDAGITRTQRRIVNIDDTPFDVPPVENMVVIQNDDRPGVIGTVGTLLGNAGVNISDMDVSRVTGSDTAVMLIAPSAPVPHEVLDALLPATTAPSDVAAAAVFSWKRVTIPLSMTMSPNRPAGL